MAITQLMEILEQLTERHERLLALSEVKRDVVIHDRVDDLMKITAEENALVKEITRLEILMRQSVVQAAAAFGVELGESHTISDLMQAMPDRYEAERNRIAKERQKLVETISRLRENNELNRQLIQQSLDYISFQIDILTDAPEQDMMYQKPTDEQQVKKRTGLFDRKA